MSFRVYPKFVKGNPQLRIFLPNFWMKLVKPVSGSPPNRVHFKVPLEMSQVDVKNYLEKIYKIPVTEVRTQVISGIVKKNFKGYLVKEDDYRAAFVTLGDGHTFKFPDLYPEDVIEKERSSDDVKEFAEKERVGHSKSKVHRADVPAWFGI